MIHWPRTIKPLVVLAVLACTLTLVPSASAGACGSRTVSQPFAPWGDTNDYFALPDGGFESSLFGWDLLAGDVWFGANQPWLLNNQQTGYSSALAIILFVAVFGAANIYVKALNRVKQR